LAEGRKQRRRLRLILGAVAVVVVYGLAADRTGVSLDEITSESRQTQLVRIIRALARPDLVTYDHDDDTTDIDFHIPCRGDDAPAVGGGVAVDPGCAEPGAVVTVSGNGFEPYAEGRIRFIPESEHDVTLPLGIFAADRDGDWSAEVELPSDRISDGAQQIQVSVPVRLGTWGDRREVWTDTNENGTRDDGVIGPDGLELTVQGARTEAPAAALLDPTNQVAEFVSVSDPVLAADGPANGAVSAPLGESRGDISIAELRSAPAGTVAVISGPEGADASRWRVAVYDGLSGEVLATAPLGDRIELSPRISEQTKLTAEKIIDTVFLALVATTVGLVVALPLSFVSARNLMRDVSTSVVGLGFGLPAVPVGAALGVAYLNMQRWALGDLIDRNLVRLILAAAGLAAVFFLGRRIFFGEELRSTWLRTARSAATLVALALSLESLFALLTAGGKALMEPFGAFDFVPGLFAAVGEVGTVLLPFVVAVTGAAIALGVARRAAFRLTERGPGALQAVVGHVAMAVGGALTAALIGAGVDWVYQIADPAVTLMIPGAAGAVLGLWIAHRGRRRGEVRIGLTIYYVARTIFNTLRSIEPLVMVIVFVVWVGFGEFAGSLALALHTAAALSKLYSEQVESISEGPMEAVRATGANRLQTIIYAVVPQIVPPYISFTMYRWDINVRMSTILGFAGGGGIGFLLQQNVRLGDYRAASVQMLAIAVVVATMDYISSRLRERFT